MTNRARIERLLLLNWKGIFFQPFELHEAVTALEGENGAGKTTVMIAAFVALLPDLQRLAFRNVGESTGGDGDRGIHGRLGIPGASYSLLELRAADGRRIVAGVCLERGAPPRIELKRFTVEGLPSDADLDPLVLIREGKTERIPNLLELREALATTGAVMEMHDSVGRYCGRLHDLGILPMRMEQPQERQRYHQMLHTSMYGGFSGSLQKGLRDYLLNEDQRLRNHVARMRENLEACRITRRRIAESEQRYQLISDVFRFGWGMLEAAFHGTRLLAVTRRAVTVQDREEHRRLCDRVQEEEHRQARLERRLQDIEQTLDDLDRQDQEALALLERCRKAHDLRIELDELLPRHARQEQDRARAEQTVTEARTAVTASRQRHEQAQRDRDQLAKNLSRAQDAFEDISRKVGQYRAACRSLDDARSALPDRQVEVDQLDALVAECKVERERALAALTDAEQELDGAEERRRRFDTLLAVIIRLAGEPVAESDAAAAAGRIDTVFRELEDRLARAEDLPERIRQAEANARRQGALRQRLMRLEASCGPLHSSERVRKARADKAGQEQSLRDRLAALREGCIEHHSAVERAVERATSLEQDLKHWRWTQALAGELRDALDEALDDTETLTMLRQGLKERSATLSLEIRQGSEQRRGLVERSEQLEFGGGRLDESLIGLADRLDGRLLAELFDDVPAAQAARAEARLGPLHAALLVPDIRAAANTVAKQKRRPTDVWLVSGAAAGDLSAGETLGDSELVRQGDAWRLSRHSERPVVGRIAREQEITRLRTEAQALDETVSILRRQLAEVDHRAEQCEQLASQAHWLQQPSPQAELKSQRRIQSERGRQLRVDKNTIRDLEPEIESLAAQVHTLEDCLADAPLLDQDDWGASLALLRQEQDRTGAGKARLERSREDLDALRRGFLALEQPPPDAARLRVLRDQQSRAETVLDYWKTARHLLSDLSERRLHFSYADQLPLLERQQGALEELRARLDALREETAALQNRSDATEAALQSTRESLNSADAALKTTAGTIADRNRQLHATGEDGSLERLTEVRRLRDAAASRLSIAQQEHGTARSEAAVAAREVEYAREARQRSHETRRDALIELRPRWRNWIALRRDVGREGLRDRLMDSAANYDKMGPPNTLTLARERRVRLIEALKAADGGVTLAQWLDRGAASIDEPQGGSGARDLHAWGQVRGFLEQSIPRDIVQSDDPEVALVQIGQHLALLRERLGEQEQALRQSTEDIANSIQVRIRQERSRIDRLNRGLGRVRFGSIKGVRIHMERQPLMDRLLEAMRLQQDLFQQEDRLEDAMAAMYRHIGGGQVQGEQLLDYRQYVRMSVQVQRIGRHQWVEARAGNLSTGESIGVGAAVLVVVLDAWEQQSALLRGRKAGQALRFLFLDEANRLSPDSLDTLTDFCQQMQVQLLAAAPAADRARRGHIYRLVRRTDSAGLEEVIVRGRRMRDEPV